jgi:hypothetical protein
VFTAAPYASSGVTSSLRLLCANCTLGWPPPVSRRPSQPT